MAQARNGPYGGDPDYDSGWVDIAQGEDKTFTHSLGGNTDDYVVDLQANHMGVTINQTGMGGDCYYDAGYTYGGYYWYGLDTTNIQVFRHSNDHSADQVRVRIWIISGSDYDSGWADMNQGQTRTFTHNMGGNPDDYVVYMQYYDTGLRGLNNRKYGLDTYHRDGIEHVEYGAAWQRLTNSSIEVYRGHDDVYANQARVRIWRVPQADYDSDWQDMPQGTSVFDHDLGGPWNDFVVDLQFKDADYYGTHQIYFGINSFYVGDTMYRHGGTFSLNSSQVWVTRGLDDALVDKARIRIWAIRKPKYDSGWVSISQNEGKTFTHNVGGDTDHYVVDLQFKDTADPGYGVNQWDYGGDDYIVYPSSTMKREGAYWGGLTSTGLWVRRQADDTIADQVRVRIWIAPPPDYDSGWTPIIPDETKTLNHGLGGNSYDYVVDLQFKDSSGVGAGVNQWHYGADQYRDPPTTAVVHGGYWRNLDSDSIDVKRGKDDTGADSVRVRIWKNTQADYDSGWTTISPASVEKLYHNLGGDADDYVVDLQFWDDNTDVGISHTAYGSITDYCSFGNRFDYGAFWYFLTNSGVWVWREVNDESADHIHVRIWYTDDRYWVYLPAVLRNY